MATCHAFDEQGATESSRFGFEWQARGNSLITYAFELLETMPAKMTDPLRSGLEDAGARLGNQISQAHQVTRERGNATVREEGEKTSAFIKDTFADQKPSPEAIEAPPFSMRLPATEDDLGAYRGKVAYLEHYRECRLQGRTARSSGFS